MHQQCTRLRGTAIRVSARRWPAARTVHQKVVFPPPTSPWSRTASPADSGLYPTSGDTSCRYSTRHRQHRARACRRRTRRWSSRPPPGRGAAQRPLQTLDWIPQAQTPVLAAPLRTGTAPRADPGGAPGVPLASPPQSWRGGPHAPPLVPLACPVVPPGRAPQAAPRVPLVRRLQSQRTPCAVPRAQNRILGVGVPHYLQSLEKDECPCIVGLLLSALPYVAWDQGTGAECLTSELGRELVFFCHCMHHCACNCSCHCKWRHICDCSWHYICRCHWHCICHCTWPYTCHRAPRGVCNGPKSWLQLGETLE